MTGIISAEVVEPLGRPAAERLDKRIRLLVTTISDSLDKLCELVEQAKAGHIHQALGFASWTAYVADACRVQVRLDRPQRRELVGYLSGEGMSQRAIADVVGVSQKTVDRDLEGESNDSPDDPGEEEVLPVVEPAEEGDHQEEVGLPAQGGVQSEPDLAPVIGLDGKRYNRPPAAPPQNRPRRPLILLADAIANDMRKLVDRINTLREDDRYERNREQIDCRLQPYARLLGEAIQALEISGGGSDD